ncbi:hypothetical protein DhcVS_1018 [Dehalococcoides mccartyi VS]|uniref:Uncharacterized protein n=1 Tax=Dehalococcoides mccartyi (strain VS) TaxID=311424 RepID=D2BII5_DEHMV|nr:hypothetical protein DhcVS_1018 [Dehalococcoides mccartyi VS]
MQVTESLLLPLCRYIIQSCRFLGKADTRQMVQRNMPELNPAAPVNLNNMPAPAHLFTPEP